MAKVYKVSCSKGHNVEVYAKNDEFSSCVEFDCDGAVIIISEKIEIEGVKIKWQKSYSN